MLSAKQLCAHLCYMLHTPVRLFDAAGYQGESGCEFREDLFDACPDRYRELTGDSLFEGVIRVCDLRDREAILYAEMASQECFLGEL